MKDLRSALARLLTRYVYVYELETFRRPSRVNKSKISTVAASTLRLDVVASIFLSSGVTVPWIETGDAVFRSVLFSDLPNIRDENGQQSVADAEKVDRASARY
ncbi:hypothetical protein Trydic_g18142 [Trypoxylus dichotomus]